MLDAHGCKLSEVIIQLLTRPADYSLSEDILSAAPEIITAFHQCQPISDEVDSIIQDIAIASYKAGIQDLVDIDTGWHFHAVHAEPTQLEDFHLEQMADQMQETAPTVWRVFDELLVGARDKKGRKREDAPMDVDGEGESDEPRDVTDADLGDEKAERGEKGRRARNRQRRDATHRIVCIVGYYMYRCF